MTKDREYWLNIYGYTSFLQFSWQPVDVKIITAAGLVYYRRIASLIYISNFEYEYRESDDSFDTNDMQYLYFFSSGFTLY